MFKVGVTGPSSSKDSTGETNEDERSSDFSTHYHRPRICNAVVDLPGTKGIIWRMTRPG